MLATILRMPLWVKVLVAAQVFVPLFALLGTDANRFGFQMFSTRGYATEVTATTSDGSDLEVPQSRLPSLRPEIDWTTTGLAEHVCARLDAAASVTVTQGPAVETVRCPR